MKPVPDAGTQFWIQSFKSVVTVLRDLLIRVLPKRIVRVLVGPGDFAFIAHPRDFSDVPRMFPFTKYLPASFVRVWFKYQWPFIASRVIRTHPTTKEKSYGWILISPLWAEDMMRNTQLAREKVISSVKLAEKLGCKIAGLGAFTSIVTHDGDDVAGKVNIGITTGNAYSAAVAVANLVHAMNLTGKSLKDTKIAVVGGAGSVGTGCSKALLGAVRELHVVDINERSLRRLVDELQKIRQENALSTDLTTSMNLSELPQCDGVIVVTNAIKSIVDASHLKKGAIVIDCAQPKNVSFNVPKSRSDVVVIESAIVRIPGLECGFDLDLGHEEAFGCLAESMILSSRKDSSLITGKVSLEQMLQIYQSSVDLGFQLAYFRNSNRLVTETDLSNLKSASSDGSNPSLSL
jgi:predicted amino acid dehydrogenase